MSVDNEEKRSSLNFVEKVFESSLSSEKLTQGSMTDFMAAMPHV